MARKTEDTRSMIPLLRTVLLEMRSPIQTPKFRPRYATEISPPTGDLTHNAIFDIQTAEKGTSDYAEKPEI